MDSSFWFGFAPSSLLASSINFWLASIRLNWSSSDADLITIPLFLVAEPAASTGLISIAIEACLDLDEGIFNRNIPGILVGLLSQFLDSLRVYSLLTS